MRREKPNAFLERLREPRWRWLRIPIGVLLVLGGVFWFLPLVGIWMIPLGLSVLAIDFPAAEKAARRLNAYARLARQRWRHWRRRRSPNGAKRNEVDP